MKFPVKIIRLLAALIIAVMVSLNVKILLLHSVSSTQTVHDRADEADQDTRCQDGEQSLRDNSVTPPDLSVRSFDVSRSLENAHSGRVDYSMVQKIGKHRRKKGFLTIGIPSIQRSTGSGSEYLVKTIGSIVNNTSEEDKKETVVVVFLAEFDRVYNTKVQKEIQSKYGNYLASGFLQAVQVDSKWYPKLAGLKRNFNDSPKRVTWRAKQNVDFAFMFLYCANISDYYIQLEDDVLSAHSFVPQIKSFIKAQNRWTVLEFSELGFIGRLFRSSDVMRFAKFLLLFYDEQPVDWLIRYFMSAVVQRESILRKPTLFQHFGLQSSLEDKPGQQNKLKDRWFADEKFTKPLQGDNPEAKVITDIRVYDVHTPELAYLRANDFFWGIGVKDGQAIYVIFEAPVRLRRVAVSTGSSEHAGDILQKGRIESCSKVVATGAKQAKCGEQWQELGIFSKGQADAKDLENILPSASAAVRIVATGSQKNWLIVYEIAVFVKK